MFIISFKSLIFYTKCICVDLLCGRPRNWNFFHFFEVGRPLFGEKNQLHGRVTKKHDWSWWWFGGWRTGRMMHSGACDGLWEKTKNKEGVCLGVIYRGGFLFREGGGWFFLKGILPWRGSQLGGNKNRKEKEKKWRNGY